MRPRPSGPTRGGRAGAVGALVLLLLPAPAAAQALRASPVQPVPEVRGGEHLVGLGAAYEEDASFPLSGLTGDLFVPGRLALAFGLADAVLLEVRWAAWRVLRIRQRGRSSVPLEVGTEDGTTSDVGDARIGFAFAPLGGRRGLALGGRVEVKLPNTSEEKGIGPNTTDVRLSVLGSAGGARWRATGDLGVAILEAPLESFEQNDVLAYAAELLLRPSARLRISVRTAGLMNTREIVPPGTEDRGVVGLGAELALRDWRVDAGVSAGYAEASAEWTLEAGIARRLGVK